MQRLEFRAMGSQIVVLLDVEATPEAAVLLDAVPGWFAEWEQCLSRFRPASELAHLNRKAGQWVPVSPVLWDVLQHALAAARASAGLVTPALLDALEMAGYDRSFEYLLPAGASAPHPATIGSRRNPDDDWQAIELDPRTHSIRVPADMPLDLGGIAKGWAAQQALQRLAVHGPVLVNVGGDIAVSGPWRDGTRWPIGVMDPLAPEQQLDVLMVATGGVATSGREYRRWQLNGVWQHHILDPRTRQPAATDVLSATIIAPSACEAEMAAKVTLILGSGAGLDWLEERTALAGLLVLEDGTVVSSHRLPDYRWKG